MFLINITLKHKDIIVFNVAREIPNTLKVTSLQLITFAFNSTKSSLVESVDFDLPMSPVSYTHLTLPTILPV